MRVLDRPADHVLLGARSGWRAPLLDRVEERDGALRLRERPDAAPPLADAEGSFGGLALPRRVAVDAGGRVYVLDAGALAVERFDPCERRLEALPCVGGEGSAPRRLRDPHGIAISSRDDLYVADTGNARVQVFALKGLALRRIVTLDADWRPWDVAIGRDGRLYASDPASGRIAVFACGGGLEDLWPLEGALDRPTDLALDREGRLYVVEEGHAEVAVLADGRVVARVGRRDELEGRFAPVAVALDAGGTLHVGEGPQSRVALEPEGVAYLGPLDSGLHRCEWHRVALSAAVPRGTATAVDTLTSESAKTFAEVASLPEERWGTRQVHADADAREWDCLVQSPAGRYLWLRLTLRGGAETPVVERAKVFYPRSSSLRFLPAVYGEDPASRDFTARFLSIFDTIRGSIASRADDAAALADPRATPADALSWLGSWLGLALDHALPVHRRRELVRRAHELYTWRGTPRGVRLQVELYTGVEPLLLEHYKLRRWLFVGDARLGDTSRVFGDAIVRRLRLDQFSRIGEFALVDSDDPLRDPFHALAHQFTVLVPARAARELSAPRLEEVVALAKPAHAQAYVEVVEPRFRIGTHAFVGLDTVVGAYPDAVVEGASRLRYDAVLGPSADEAAAPRLRVGRRSRIGSSTVID